MEKMVNPINSADLNSAIRDRWEQAVADTRELVEADPAETERQRLELRETVKLIARKLRKVVGAGRRKIAAAAVQDELEPCPFCGSASPQILTKWNPRRRCYFLYVACDLCHATGQTVTAPDDERALQWDAEPAQQAIRAWNRRRGEVEE